MGRKRHFIAGLGNSAINLADRWWEKEKAKGEKSKAAKIESSIDSNRDTVAAMENDITGGQ